LGVPDEILFNAAGQITYLNPAVEGKVKDYAEIARLGGVTRARVTQVMNFLSLAPGLQERLLSGNINNESERTLRRFTHVVEWLVQDL